MSGAIMRQSALITLLLLVVCASATSFADDGVVTFGPWEQFAGYPGYPRKEKLGDRGHIVYASWFTGRWFCGVITAGARGEYSGIPFAAPGRPITDQRVVAITAFDPESDSGLCLHIAREYQPSVTDDFYVQVISKDRMHLILPSQKGAGKLLGFKDVTISLSDKSITCEPMAEEAARRWVKQEAAARRYVDADPMLSEGEPTPFPFGDGWMRFQQVDVGDRPVRLMGPGSRAGRVIQFEALPQDKFAILERDALSDGREYWLLSEGAFQFPATAPSKICRLVFPRLLLPPVSNFVVAVEMSGITSARIFSIADGRIRELWTAPPGRSIMQLELSEDEKHVAVGCDLGRPEQVGTVSVELSTGEVTTFSNTHDILEGITNHGDLVLMEPTGRFYIRRRSGDSKKLPQPIRETE